MSGEWSDFGSPLIDKTLNISGTICSIELKFVAAIHTDTLIIVNKFCLNTLAGIQNIENNSSDTSGQSLYNISDTN